MAGWEPLAQGAPDPFFVGPPPAPKAPTSTGCTVVSAPPVSAPGHGAEVMILTALLLVLLVGLCLFVWPDER